MSSPDGEASAVPASDEVAPLTAEELFGLEDDEEEASAEDGEETPDDEIGDEDVEVEDDEAEQPALEAPATFNKAEKEAFSQLPPVLQQALVETEKRRAQDVQRATTEAANARKDVQQQALGELAQIKRAAADELSIYAQYLQPIEPDHMLLATDPQGYAAQVAIAKQMEALNKDVQARIAALRGEGDQAGQQATSMATQREAEVLQRELPEWFDPAKRAEMIPVLDKAGEDLGYSPEQLAQANARDIIALKRHADAMADAQKWRDAQSRKMANVRAARGKPKVALPGNARTRAETKAGRAQSAWERAATATNRNDREAGFAEYLEATGLI